MFAGNSKFGQIGNKYPDNVPLFALRLVPALCGSLLIPAAYFLTLELGCRQWTAALASFLLLAGKPTTRRILSSKVSLGSDYY